MACIPGLAKIDQKTLETLTYLCPRCHGRRRIFIVGPSHRFAAYTADLATLQGLYDGNTPVFPEGMEISRRATGTHGARLNTSPLAIVELFLEHVCPTGTPAHVLHTYLQATFAENPGDLKLFQRKFNIKTANLSRHRRSMEKLVSSLEE
jgi:hypothetical protein